VHVEFLGGVVASSPLFETMRALARDRARRTGGSKSIGAVDASYLAEPPHSLGVLRQRLQPLLAQVDVSDAQSVASARGPALHEILPREFGPDFRRDSQFQSLT
jgi:hypothetical protein